jgi:hypothetical protein
MSDYLGNLIARTASPAVAVRPQLPSLFEPVRAARETRSRPEFEEQDFVEQPPVTGPSHKLALTPLSISTPRSPTPREPAPATRETESGPEFEQENFVEQPPVTGPSDKFAPTRLSIPTLGSSRLREPEQTGPEVSPAKKTLRAGRESEPALQPRIFPRSAPTLREDKPSNSTKRRSDIIKSPLRDPVASASHEVSALEETWRSQPTVALKPVTVPNPRDRELPARSEVQAIASIIRPLLVPPTPKRRPEPTINVTIGRVEIRAVPPPPQQQAKPKPATVLSLEEYLRQRATSGGSR